MMPASQNDVQPSYIRYFSGTANTPPPKNASHNVMGFNVRISRDDDMVFLTSMQFDSLVACGETLLEAEKEFEDMVRSMYEFYSQQDDVALTPDAVELRDYLRTYEYYFQGRVKHNAT